MLMHTRFITLSHFVLLFCLLSFASTSQEALRNRSFIKQNLFCVEQNKEIIELTSREHNFQMFSLLDHPTPPESFGQVLDAANKMLNVWLTSTENLATMFTNKYMNLELYTTQFRNERFEPIVNVVWKKLAGMWVSEERFADWADHSRDSWMTFDQFTNLVPPQKALIEEFEKIPELIETWSEMFPSMIVNKPVEDEEDAVQVDTVSMFGEMKATTVDYLGLIFMAAFEFEEEEFYTEDNTLETFWETFHPWLEVGHCNSLVSYALAGKLGQVKNVEILRKLMASNVPDMNNPISLKVEDMDAFVGAFTEGAGFSKTFKEWSFYTEENLSQVLEMSQSKEVSHRIEFDQLRIENRDNCLDFIAELENFTSMKNVAKMRAQFLIENHYYFFIEYLLLRVQTTPNEFKDKVRALRAVQIIYIFMNQILNEEHPELKSKPVGYTIVQIILRIINGMDLDGNLRTLIPGNILDEETEQYIYTLLFIITESNDLPKPEESEELNRVRKNRNYDDDPEDPSFRVDPRGPKFAYIYNRIYKMAGNSQFNNVPYILRYKKKYYMEDLAKNNPIYAMDDIFYQLELKMSSAFTGRDYGFDGPKGEYDNAKQQYFAKYVKNEQNMPVRMLVKVFATKYNAIGKPPAKVDAKEWVETEYNKLFLEGFSVLRSNFMEMQYVEAIILATTMLKKPLPDFTWLFTHKMEDNDRNNMFEFIKRVFTNLKHTRSAQKDIIMDTVDINATVYDDRCSIQNGERFHTLVLDAMYFFGPEITRLSTQHSASQDAKLAYRDLSTMMTSLKQSFRILQDDAQSKQLRDFRLMMTWNIFDDIEEYMPLVGRFIEETKSSDMEGSNAVKMEMLVENFTNMYLAILEHRIFAAQHNFSFASADDRLDNLMAYLFFVRDQYDDMLSQALPAKEVRFSKLNIRQTENLIYFMNYRLKTILDDKQEDSSGIVLSNVYYPYGFREIYALSDNHPEIKSTLEIECEDILSAFEIEKTSRLQNYTTVTIDQEMSKAPNFRFCILMAFNRDMLGLIENQASTNNSRNVMLTITRESIFQTLVVPYYDKLTAHELVIQVFNLNMSHAKAVARESAEKFSNYIALLDSFLLILDDLEDGRNDTIELENFPKGEIDEALRDFCLQLEKTDQEDNKNANLRFIRELMLEKLEPEFFAPGANLKQIFAQYVNQDPKINNINAFMRYLRYGWIDIKGQKALEMNPMGDDVDTELLALLMIYAPHSEFTAELLYQGNFMSKMPQYVRTAQDNYGYIYKYYTTPTDMQQVFELAHQRKMDSVKDVQSKLNEEATLSFDGQLDIDLDGFIDEEDFDMNAQTSMWSSQEIEVKQSDIGSNVQVVDKLEKILVEESVTKIQLNSQNSHLEGQNIIIDQVITSSMESDKDVLKIANQLNSSEQLQLNQINIVESGDQYLDNMIQAKNIIKSSNSNGQASFKIEDHNESAMKSFKDEVAETSLNNQTNAVFRLKVTSKDGLNDEMQKKLFEQAALKLGQKFNAEKCVVKVSGSSVTQTFKQTNKMTTHLDQSASEFNLANQEIHMKGSHNSSIRVIQDGQVVQSNISSGQFNQTLNNPSSSQAEIKQLLTNGMQQVIKQNSQKYLRLV